MTKITCIVFAVVCLFTCTIKAQRVFLVGPQHEVATIREAISLSIDGDTIRVAPGVYREGNIIINKSIVLEGIGYPVLDGEKKHEVLSVTADHVVISGFNVQRSGVSSLHDYGAIKVYDSRYVTISDNILEDNFFGIYFQNSRQGIIRDNVIRAYGVHEHQIGNGIHAWKCDSLQIISNTVSGHRDGIYLEFATNSVIWRNIGYDNIRYGLHFMFAHDNAYITNVFRQNGAGVAVMYSRNIKMINNKFMDNWGDAAYGLLLKDITDSYMRSNHFIRNTTGIFMDGSNRVTIEDGVFKENGWGLKIQANSIDNVITRNNFLGNTFDISTNSMMVWNNFDGNYWDRYEGYDLDRDGTGDIPFRPLSLFSVIVERYPAAMLLYRSFIVTLLDKAERMIPSLTPDNFIDQAPRMTPVPA